MQIPKKWLTLIVSSLTAVAAAQTTNSPSTTQQLPNSPSSQSSSQTSEGKTKGTQDKSEKGAPSGTSNDRLFYALPNFLTLENGQSVPPLTAAQKFRVVARGTFDPVNFVWYGLLAGISQANNSEAGYGQGAAGYGKRYGAAFGDSAIENFFVGAVYPSILRQDPRFYQLGKGSFLHRTGYSSGTFLHGVRDASPAQRVIALAVAGVIGALGWWALRRWARPVVSVEASVAGASMPKRVTIANAALQIVIVGLGASIGREVAPRELGAMVAGWLSARAGLTSRERRILVACGAGAGLAAVYDVPLGGAVFAVEILLAELSLATALPALATAAIATLVAQLVVPTGPLYTLPQLTLTPTLLVWSVVAGPVVGFAALGFVRATKWALAHRITGNWVLFAMPLIFLAVGFLAIPFPRYWVTVERWARSHLMELPRCF